MCHSSGREAPKAETRGWGYDHGRRWERGPLPTRSNTSTNARKLVLVQTSKEEGIGKKAVKGVRFCSEGTHPLELRGL